MTYASALWQFARPRTLAVIWLHIGLFYVAGTAGRPEYLAIVIAMIASAAIYINAVAVNDLSDIKVDMINLSKTDEAKERPIINKTITSHATKSIIILSALVAIVCSLFIQPWLAIVMVLCVIANMIYSLPPTQISKRGVFAQLLLPTCYVLMPFALAVGMINNEIASLQVWLVCGMYALFIGRLYLKDIRDEKGDRTVGKKTYLVRHGMKLTLLQSSVWAFVGIIICVAGLVLAKVDFVLIVSVGLLTISGYLWSCWQIFKEPVLKHKLLYVAMAGRFASMWLFIVFLLTVLTNAEMTFVAKLYFTIVTTGIFLFGVLMLKEELQAMKA